MLTPCSRWSGLGGFGRVRRKLKISQSYSINTIYVRSMSKQSSVVWSSSITKDESSSLEQIQKVALKIIYRGEYCLSPEAKATDGQRHYNCQLSLSTTTLYYYYY